MAVPCPVGNSAAHPWVVQKFGGTSVGKFPDKVGFQSRVCSRCIMGFRTCHASSRGAELWALYPLVQAMGEVTSMNHLTDLSCAH